jgi:RNA polymerase sigma-70 factor (ECF subfamily)
MARRLLGSGAEAEDAVQEVFIELWRSAHRFNPERGTEPQFIAMIARRKMIDRIRHRARRPVAEELGDEQVDTRARSGVEAVDRSDEAARALRAVEQLRPEQQQVLRLSIHQGLSHAEIAREMSLPLGTVKTHLRRGLLRLREMLQAPDRPSRPEAS